MQTHVTDEQTAKCDQLSGLLGPLDGLFAIVSSSGDKGTREPDIADEVVRLIRYVSILFSYKLRRKTHMSGSNRDVPVVANTRLDDMKVRQLGKFFRQTLNQVGESRDGILHTHVFETQCQIALREGCDMLTVAVRPGAEAYGRLLDANGLADGLNEFEREPRTVLDGAAILVRAVVRDVLDELVDEISVRAMQLDAVEPGALDCVHGRLGEERNVASDVCARRRGNGQYSARPGRFSAVAHRQLSFRTAVYPPCP